MLLATLRRQCALSLPKATRCQKNQEQQGGCPRFCSSHSGATSGETKQSDEARSHDEFTQKTADEKAKEEQRTKDDDEDEAIRSRVLSASLQFVPAYGWTRAAVEAGTETLGYPTVTSGIVKNADIDLVHFHVGSSNKALETAMKAEREDSKGTPLKIGPFVRRNVEKRLRMNGPYINRWSEALVIQANPQYAPQSLELSLKLMDSIWHYAGCQSTDMNWYTKRLTLLAIYKSSELAMMNDKSDDFKETWEFLDRRLADHKSLTDLIVSPEDVAKVVSAVGTVLQSVIGLKR